MKKKILSLVLALLMSASSAAFVAAEDDVEAIAEDAAVTSTSEVSEDDPYAWAVEFLYNYGIYKGTSASDLATEEDIQRYQMALFVARISTGWVDDDKWEDGPENTSIFSDIGEGAASNYLGAISYANQKGIIEGYGNGKFGPYDGITYQNALTMVVRTLGYQGLDWPWGYIEKAVELGLTQGIVDVAYTDVLTRGEVAQIIYNALFAETKSGSTLALDHFGIEFGWEPIVITASDLDVYEKGGVTTPADSNKTNAWVSFKLYNEDGSVDTGKDAVTYYALAEALGLDADKHEDDLAVGSTYWVLFEKDADSNFVKVVDYRSTVVDVIWNEGRTDDEGAKQDYDIQAVLADYTLVSKYTPANYVTATKFLKPEIMVYNALGSIVETEKGGSTLAIDWETGDILVPCKPADADYIADGADEEKGTGYYKVAWYYNPTLDKYYRYEKDTDNGVIGIDWMTDAEFEKTYKDALEDIEVPYTGFNKTLTSIATSAYASLVLEDVDLDGVAERGIYEEYGLGYFKNTTKRCGSCGKDYAAFSIAPVTNEMATKDTAEDGWKSSKGTIMGAANVDYTTAPCGHNNYKTAAWFAEGYAPSVDEDGAYLDGYVIYSYDPDTKEIKIVKEITNGSDVDSFVATGVLRAYSPAKKTVVVGDTTYPTTYDELKNTGFYKTADNKAKYSVGLDSMLNQFVEYVVVDGEVVAMYLKGETTAKYLVVKDYVGMTNDGYIAVDAYSTADAKLSTYCIGSYNGWKQGDYYYYLTEEKVRDSFSAGTIYYIKSYDEVKDVYYVELVGDYDDDYQDRWTTYTVDGEKVSLKTMTLSFKEDGYREILVGGKKTAEARMKSDDKYIILAHDAASVTCKAPIYVFTGKVADTDWTVTGDRIATIPGDNVFVMVNVTDIVGFNLDAYESGMYLYEGGKVLEAAYDSAYGTIYDDDFKVEDRYILGATTFTVEALNLYTGKRDAIVLDKNIDLEKNHIYVTVSGKVVEEWDPWADEEIPVWDTESFIFMMADWFYQDRGLDAKYFDTADYLFGFFHFLATDKLDKAYMNTVIGEDWYTYVRNRVNNITFYISEYDGDEMVITYTDLAKFLKDNPDVTGLGCGYVYEVATGNVVIYANEARTSRVKKVTDEKVTLVNGVNGVDGVNLNAYWTYDVYYNVDGTIDHVVIHSVEFKYDGAENMGHNDRALKGLGFGHLSDHLLGSYTTSFNGLDVIDPDTDTSYPYIDLYVDRFNDKKVVYTTWECEENLCDIVRSIKFVNLELTVVNGEDDDYVTEYLDGLRDAIRFNLDLAIIPALPTGGDVGRMPIATWNVWTAMVIKDDDVDNGLIFNSADKDQAPTANGFLATNPDAIQDTFTAEAE